MIRYDLKCADGHDFESWFASSDAYDKLAAAGMVACAVCGSVKVEKALMAPRVPKKGGAAAQPVLSAPGGSEMESKLAALRKEIEANSDDVGRNFATEARRIHVGEAKVRAIHGEATHDEAKSLIEDGVPVAPLPFTPRRNS